MSLVEMMRDDDYIQNVLRKALDCWLDGGGSLGAFMSEVVVASKDYFKERHSEWRGALLLYLVTGAGIKISKEASIQTKLLLLDCLNNWSDAVSKDNKGNEYSKTQVLTEINRIRDYAEYSFGMKQLWCIKLLDDIVRGYCAEKFWVSTGVEEKVSRIP